MKASVMLIGIGNGFRSDDGVGIAIARKLHVMLPASFTVMEASGEGTELISAWQGYKQVYLFDAVMNQGQPGCIHRFEASRDQFPTDFFKYSSHAFSLAEAVELSRILGNLPHTLVVFGVEGKHFHHGEQLTDEVVSAVDEVVTRVTTELGVKLDEQKEE